MLDTLLYWLVWKWIPMSWRIRLENAWYWIVDAPMSEPPDYVRTFTARTRRPVPCPECGKHPCGGVAARLITDKDPATSKTRGDAR